jgi:hypothetical protein
MLVRSACLRSAIAVAALGSLAAVADEGARAEPATSPASVIKRATFAVALPTGWSDRKDLHRGPMVIYAMAPGPLLDELGSPLQIGMTIERFANEPDWLTAGVARQIQSARDEAPRLQLRREPTSQPVTLSDGSPATLLKFEFDKERGRRSLQLKLMAADKNGTGWVASGFVVGSSNSVLPAPDSDAAKWIEAHVKTFTFDRDKLDTSALPAAPAFDTLEEPR